MFRFLYSNKKQEMRKSGECCRGLKIGAHFSYENVPASIPNIANSQKTDPTTTKVTSPQLFYAPIINSSELRSVSSPKSHKTQKK